MKSNCPHCRHILDQNEWEYQFCRRCDEGGGIGFVRLPGRSFVRRGERDSFIFMRRGVSGLVSKSVSK